MLRGCLWHEGSDGLGVGPMWLRMLLPYRKRFDKAARKHDECYDTRGDGFARELYDLLFLCGCLEASGTTMQRIVAYMYYALVRLFGWAFYRYNRDDGRGNGTLKGTTPRQDR